MSSPASSSPGSPAGLAVPTDAKSIGTWDLDSYERWLADTWTRLAAAPGGNGEASRPGQSGLLASRVSCAARPAAAAAHLGSRGPRL
jgi:hypothetical protein